MNAFTDSFVTESGFNTACLSSVLCDGVLDAAPGESFGRITRLARQMMRTPIVTVSVGEAEQPWFTRGLKAPLVVADAQSEARFADRPILAGEPGMRFCLAVPLRTHDGHIIGVLSAFDHAPRDVDGQQIELMADLAQLVVDELELRQLAATDSLTGALTRRAFLREGQRTVQMVARYGRPASCIMLDVDHFKRVNDHCGHAAGDEVLRAVAAACRGSLRRVDSFGRLGGEEFAILLPETTLAGACATAERLRQEIAGLEIATPDGPVRVTVSFGVAEVAADDTAPHRMLAAADAALYRAKAGGRNRVMAG